MTADEQAIYEQGVAFLLSFDGPIPAGIKAFRATLPNHRSGELIAVVGPELAKMEPVPAKKKKAKAKKKAPAKAE